MYMSSVFIQIYIYIYMCVYIRMCMCKCIQYVYVFLCACVYVSFPGKGGAVNTRHGTICMIIYVYMICIFQYLFTIIYIFDKNALIGPALDQDGNFHPNPQ